MAYSPSINGASSDRFHTEYDDAGSVHSQFLRDDTEAFYLNHLPTRPSVSSSAPFYYDHLPAQPPTRTAPGDRVSQSILNPLSKHSQFTLHTPLPTNTEYVDPFIAVKEMLWLLPGINEIVSNTLDRMEKAFAYNSVYFLKVILDLQSLYIPMRPEPPQEAILAEESILKIAGVLSGRLAKKESDTTSLSRELQLRTLISALSLLYQLNVGKLNSDTYAKLLRDVTEREAENEARVVKGDENSFRTGDNEFLTRYACDLIRCLPNDFPPTLEKLSQGSIHFLFAAGFINQLEQQPSKKTISDIFARVTAPPSQWHKDMRHLLEGTVAAIFLHQLAESDHPTEASQYADILANEVSQTVLERLEQQLETFDAQRDSSGVPHFSKWSDGTRSELSRVDSQMFICGLLDLLSQLVSTFPRSGAIVADSKALALKLIRDSDQRAFRYKAFEIMINSTLGVGEKEYYDTMRNLEIEIEETARLHGNPDTRSEEQILEALNRVEQLKIEKREAMERCERKNVLATGAIESMQRRLQWNAAGKTLAPLDGLVQIGTPWTNEETRTASPVPSSIPSRAPTLSVTGQSWETVSCESPTVTPTDEQSLSAALATISPTDTTCKSITPIDTLPIVLSPTSPNFNEEESPVIPVPHPFMTNRRLPVAVPEPEPDTSLYREMSQLFSAGLSLFEEPMDDYSINGSPTRQSIYRNSFPNRHSYHSAQNSPTRNAYNRSSDTLESYASEPAIRSPAEQESPLSTYPEPSLTRHPSAETKYGSLKRRSRVRRTWSLQLDKPLPPVGNGERTREAILAENAPEPVVMEMTKEEPVGRSQSAMGVRDEMSRRSSTFGFRTPQMPRFTGFTPLPPIADIGVECIPEPAGPAIDYEAIPIETIYKFHSKDSCFATVVSADTKHAVFLSPHSFQVFAIPAPDQTPQLKPKFHYRLGDWEGLKKSKVRWQYKAAAISDRYVVTITKERLQVHDLADDCHVIYNDAIKGWEYSCVSIAANKLVVGLSKALRGEDIGMLRIYRMNAPTFDGHRYERCGKDIHLPIHPQHAQDAPHLVTLTKDGNYVTCGTPRFGYYFAWDISRFGEPKHLATSQLKRYEGPDAERLTGVTLFPDARHLLCSTFPPGARQNDLVGGSFTEAMYPGHAGDPDQRPLRQVSLRISQSCVAPAGDACAFLSKNGTVWVTPVTLLEGDDNLTSFAPTRSKERLLATSADVVAGMLMLSFSPAGRRLVTVDRKGKCLILSFPEKSPPEPLIPPPYLDTKEIDVPELSPQQQQQGGSPEQWLVKSEVGGFY